MPLPESSDAAAQVGGVDQGRAGGIQLRHKRVAVGQGTVTAGGLERVTVGKSVEGQPRHVGVAGGIDGDAVATSSPAAAQVGGVDQGRAGGIQLGHKRVAELPLRSVACSGLTVGKSVEQCTPSRRRCRRNRRRCRQPQSSLLPPR